MTDLAPLVGLAGLILVKEVGVPIPVPGDLVVLGAGVAASRGQLDPVVALAAIIVASILGGIVQFALLRSIARPAALRLLARVAGGERLDQQAERFRESGPARVALARMTPGVRIAAVAASALAGVRPAAFVAGLTVGNAVFIAAHFGLGFVVGEPVVRMIGGAFGQIAVAGVALAVAGAFGWLVIARLRRQRQPLPGAMAAWVDACCPACLAAGFATQGPGVTVRG